MNLIRPKPRYADDVSDAFEQLFSASPMSKLLSVESGSNANNSVLTPSSFKLPANVTPVAKIFFHLKKSEGSLSVDSDGHSRHGNNQFSASNTDSDSSSRLSLEQQQQQIDLVQRSEPLNFSTKSYLGSQALERAGYTNCDERPGMETGKEYTVLMSPRIYLQRLDENVEENEESVIGGQGSLHDIEEEEEENADVMNLGEEEQMGHDLEENVDIAELSSEEKMMSHRDSEESEQADDQAELRKHGFSEQTRKHAPEVNVQSGVRKRKKKARIRSRSFAPKESESSESESERSRPETHRRHHREERHGTKDNDAVARDSEEQGGNGCDGNIESEKRKRWLSQEDEQYDECEASRWTTRAPISRSQHFTDDEPNKQDTERRDTHNSKDRQDTDRKTSEEEEVRKQPSEEDWECDVNRRLTRITRQEHAATDVNQTQSATYSESKSNKEFIETGTTTQIASRLSKTSNHRKPQSSHRRCSDRANDDENVTRKPLSFHQEKGSTRMQSVLIPRSTNQDLKTPDKKKMAETTVAISCETPPFRRVTRIMSANRRFGIRDKSREANDHSHAKKASVDEVRPVDQQKAKEKTTTAPDLGETPVISRKLLKVSAVRQHTLDNWTIVRLGYNIGVDGHRPDDPPNQFWHSNAIVKRISSHAVCTVSGTVYTLRGKLAQEEAHAEGFSKKVVAAFQKGFPPAWKEIIQEHNEKIKRKRSSKTRPGELKMPSELKTPVEQRKVKPTKRPNTQPLKHPSVTATPEMPVMISRLSQTRSGRHVIPQLKWWTGQRVTIDPNCQTVAIAPGTPDTLCATVSSHKPRRCGSQQNKNHVTNVGKQEVTGAQRHRREGCKIGLGKHKDSRKGRQNSNVNRKKEEGLQGPTRKLQHRRKNSEVRNNETEALNTPMQRLFTEHMADVNNENVADIDDTNNQQSPQLMDTVNRQQGTSENLVKTLKFLERHERTGASAPVMTTSSEVLQVRRGEIPSDEAGSYVSDSTNKRLGHEDSRTIPMCKLDYLNGVETASEVPCSETNTGASLDKNRQAKPGCVANITRDILRFVKSNKTAAKQRMVGKTLPCYSLRNNGTVRDSPGSKSDDGATKERDLDAGDVRQEERSSSDTRNNLTALVKTPRQREDTVSLRRHWNNIQSGHASDTMPLDILQTQERVSRRSALSDAPRKTPVSRFKQNMTDDILCHSVEHKRLFSSEDIEVRRHSDKPLRPGRQRNGRSDKTDAVHSGKANGGLCCKERNTNSTEAMVRRMNVKKKTPRNRSGRFYSPEKKDALLPKSRQNVLSARRISSDDDEDEQTTTKHVMSRQKASKAPEKTKRKTAAAPSDKQEKLSGMFVGGVGTLKRKRQLREFVEQHECGYENDLFDSTPFQQRKIRKVAPLVGIDAVDDFFNVTAGRLSFATPGATPSTSLRSAWLPTSDKKTPSSSMTASPLLPESVNRNAVDRYVNRLKRVAKRRGTKLVLGTTVAARNQVSGPWRVTGETIASVSPSVFHMVNRSDNVDSSNPDDYYFSDGSDVI